MMKMSIDIPNKSHFKLNEVCGLTGVKPYVLRFWEAEFEEIDPILSSSGQKLYEHKDIEVIAFIKKLLFDDKLSIEQAKHELRLLLHHPTMEQADSALNETEEVSIGHSSVSMENTTAFQRKLSDKDIEKLTMAKQRLNSLMEMTQALQHKHDWH